MSGSGDVRGKVRPFDQRILHGPVRLATRAATRIDCAATNTAIPLQMRSSVGGPGPKVIMPMQHSEPAQSPREAKPQSSPPIMIPFAGYASPLKNWQTSTGVRIEWHAARTAASVVNPATMARGRSVVNDVTPPATRPPARHARWMICQASDWASVTASAAAFALANAAFCLAGSARSEAASRAAASRTRNSPNALAKSVCVAIAIASDSCDSVTPKLKQSRCAADATGPSAAAALEQRAYTATFPHERANTCDPARPYSKSIGPSPARFSRETSRKGENILLHATERIGACLPPSPFSFGANPSRAPPSGTSLR
eukprot:scaffold262369_cov33-Tisochrysis_lutea.AAC.1